MARKFARGARGAPVNIAFNTDWEETVIDEVLPWAQEVAAEAEDEAKATNLYNDQSTKMRQNTFVRARKLGKRVIAIEGGSSVPYFLFIEYGTKSGKKSNIGNFPQPRGYQQSGKSGGIDARPFIRTALSNLLARHTKLGGTT